MKALSNYDNIELFESPCIQTIIDFKWTTYTFDFFQDQFIIFIYFVLFFVVDLYVENLFLVNISNDGYARTQLIHVSYMLKACCFLVLLNFIIYELKSALKQSIKEYVKDTWNLFDFLLISTYSVASYFSIFYGQSSFLLVLNCLLLILTFVKVNFYLRIYDGFSFMVSML